MIARGLAKEVLRSLKFFPSVGIIGSRQVGKTTLAKEIQKRFKRDSIYLDLELTSDLNKLNEAELYLKQFEDSLVIIDEVQRLPSLFPLLRALIDRKRTAGRFLLLGSASPDMLRNSSESLAGRIVYHELAPFSLQEVGQDQEKLRLLWLRGGYPESYLAPDDAVSLEWRRAFIRTYLERDIPQLGIRTAALQLQRFWTMVAHCHGQLWNSSMIAKSLGVSPQTVRHYLDILTHTFLLRQLVPFHANVRKRLVKASKVYLRDSGLLHALLDIGHRDALQGHPVLGHSWEGFIIEQIIRMIPGQPKIHFYRTAAGGELDLLIQETGGGLVAIEVKHTSSPKISKGFRLAFDDLGCERGFVVYPGDEKYQLGERIVALPAVRLSDIWLPSLDKKKIRSKS